MKHLAMLRQYVTAFKKTKEYVPDEKSAGSIDGIIELFLDEEDKDFTTIDRLNLFKFIVLHPEGNNIFKFTHFTEQFFRDSFLSDEFILTLNKFPDGELFLLLENFGLFNIEICKLLVQNEAWLTSNILKGMLMVMKENEIPITHEIFERIITNFNLLRTIDVLCDSLHGIRVLLNEDVKVKQDLIALAKENIRLVLTYISTCTIADLEEIYSFFNKHGLNTWFMTSKDNIFEAHLTFHQISNQFLYDNYLYSFPKIQDESKIVLAKTLPSFSSDLVNLVCQYNFFKKPLASFIPIPNPISLHFLHEAEDKDYSHKINQYKKTIEGFGSFATKFVEEILISLGIKNFYSIVLGGKGVSNYLEFIKELAICWPNPNDDYRHLGVIVPTLPNEEGIRQHATALLFDLKQMTLEVIDPLGLVNSGMREIMRWINKAKKFKTKDLDPQKENVQTIKVTEEFANNLCHFKIIHPNEYAPAQQIDQSTCVLHNVANFLGMVLFKENKKINPKFDPDKKIEKFLNSIYLDLVNGVGISPRSVELLHHLAGIMYIASERISDEKYRPSFKA